MVCPSTQGVSSLEPDGENNMPSKIRHGQAIDGQWTGAYKSWASMHRRCRKPYKGYEKVSVCKRWRVFEKFYEDMGDRPEGLTLDRINGKGNYTPKNCRWATATVQMRNKPVQKRSASGIKGVRFYKGAWQASICVDYKQIHLGRVKTKEEAIAARQQGEKDYWKCLKHHYKTI